MATTEELPGMPEPESRTEVSLRGAKEFVEDEVHGGDVLTFTITAIAGEEGVRYRQGSSLSDAAVMFAKLDVQTMKLTKHRRAGE